MTKTIFLQKNSNFNFNEKVNIILSSQLYWLRTFDIPIDSLSEVKAVIPSFFEDFFDIENYKFYVIKVQKHKYMCFAYNENDIVQTIKNANLEFKNISNIYFAQNELSNIFENEVFYEINESTYAIQENSIVQIPNSLSINIKKQSIDLENIKLSKHKIYINQSSKYIDLKTAYILSFLLIIFSLINFSKTLTINNDINEFDNKIQLLKEKYNLPMSKIQTKSIINEYISKEVKHNKLLSAMEYLLKYRNIINTKIVDISYNNFVFNLKFENKNKAALKKYILKKFKIISINESNDLLNIKIKI